VKDKKYETVEAAAFLIPRVGRDGSRRRRRKVRNGISRNGGGKVAGALLLAAFGVLLGVSLSAARESVSSQVRAITLLSNQALVTREAEVQVHKGFNEILLAVEAFRVDPDSVSARVFGAGEVYSVQLKEIYLEEAPQENIRAVEERLRELKASLQAVEDSKTVLKNKEQFLGSVIDFSKTQVPQDIKTSFPQTEDLEKTLTFLGSSFEKIHHQRRTLNDKAEEFNEQIQAVEKELASLTAGRQREEKAIEVLFNAEQDQPIRIQATYLAYNAFWQPLYKAAVPLDLGAVHLTMFSKVRQKTGEDWRDADLSVSNVVPLRGAGLPELPSWILDMERADKAVYRQKGFGMRPKAAVQTAADETDTAASEEAEAKEEAPFVDARRKELPLSFEYQMPRKLTIPSKDKETILPLFTKTLKGEFVHYAAPKINPMSFLVCKATADKELLGGPMNVHFGTHFVGKTFLKEKKPGETFDLNLGADREVKIKRETITDKIKETFFGKFERNTVVRRIAFRITAENLKDKPVTVHILDSVPVSRTDKIQVEDLQIEPEPAEKNYQSREGVHRWSLDLQPEEVKQIDVSFVVSYPKEEPVLGL
jgi:uncharacterized protein (TIGR02231 family)